MEKYLKSRKAGPRVYSVNSLSDFVELATWLYSNEDVIFRGQTKGDGWPLVPSVGRNSDGSGACGVRREWSSSSAKSIPHVDLVPANNWQWLALAQHNNLRLVCLTGPPTRWSLSGMQ